jgi:hypothetical protein
MHNAADWSWKRHAMAGCLRVIGVFGQLRFQFQALKAVFNKNTQGAVRTPQAVQGLARRTSYQMGDETNYAVQRPLPQNKFVE